jgi:hypothetical protein
VFCALHLPFPQLQTRLRFVSLFPAEAFAHRFELEMLRAKEYNG